MTVRKAKSKRALLLKNAFIDVSSPCESYAIITPDITISLFYYKFPTLFREPMASGFGPSGRLGEDVGGHVRDGQEILHRVRIVFAEKGIYV
jgi:hypothetical protein